MHFRRLNGSTILYVVFFKILSVGTITIQDALCYRGA